MKERRAIGTCCRCGQPVYIDENPIVDDGTRCLVRHRTVQHFPWRRSKSHDAHAADEVACITGPAALETWRSLLAV